MFKGSIWIIIVFCGFIFSAPPRAYSQADKKTVLIIKPGDIEPIPTIIKNVRSYLKKTDPDVRIEEVAVESETSALNAINKTNPAIILLVGKDIGKALVKDTDSIPLVISDMFKPAYAQTFPRDRCVIESLYIRPETSIEYIQKMIFDVKTIAIVYNPEKNADVVDDAEKYAQNHDLSIKRFPVSSEKDIRNITSLGSDVILLLPDTLVCNPTSLRHVMELCLQEKVPMMGISEYFAQTGTVMAVAPNFDTYSQHIASTISQILHGAKTTEMLTSFPEKVDYFINAAMARTKGVMFKPGIMTGAKRIFGQ